MDPTTLGKRIELGRVAKRMTTGELAVEINELEIYVKYIERDAVLPSQRTLAGISGCLDLDSAELERLRQQIERSRTRA